MKISRRGQVKIPQRGLGEKVKKGVRVKISRKGPSEKVSVHSSVQSGGSSSLDLFARSRRSTTHHNTVHKQFYYLRNTIYTKQRYIVHRSKKYVRQYLLTTMLCIAHKQFFDLRNIIYRKYSSKIKEKNTEK